MNTATPAPTASATIWRTELRAELLPQLQDSVVFWVTTRIVGVISATEDALFERAVNSADAAAQNRCFAAMQELRTRRGWLVAGIQQELVARIELALAPTAPAGAPEWVDGSAHELVIANALEQHDSALLALNRLLNGLLGCHRFEGARHSIAGPELLYAALAGACTGPRLSADAGNALAEAFAGGVLAGLDELCAQCAGLLVDAGVLPATVNAEVRAIAPGLVQAERALRARIVAGCGVEPTRRLVQLVFTTLAGDTRFVPRLRRALAALEGPVLEAAARDSDFFTQPQHPLRRAIADIAALGIGICEADAAGEDGQLLEIERFVSALRAPALSGVQSTRVLEEFAAWCASEQHRARLEQRRVEDCEQARVLASTARGAIERVIARELGAQRLPACAEEMLREGFHRVLVHAWLRGGTEGAGWQEALAGLAAFMALWRSGAACLPETLAERLREAMVFAGCDPLRVEILLRGVDEELASWDPPATVDVPGLMQVTEEALPETLAGDTQLDAAASLPRQAWLAFAPGVAAAARAQLALRCGEPERMLFVGRYGQRAAVFTREDLAQLLACGRARVLEVSDPLERALLALQARDAHHQEHAA